MSGRDDDEGGSVLRFPRIFMPGSRDAAGSEPADAGFTAQPQAPTSEWPELPWAGEMAPPPALNLPAIPTPREVAEDDGMFAPVAFDDPDNPTVRDTVQLAMALVTAMGVAAAQGMWHRARQRQAQADRARANADKASGKTAGGSGGSGPAGRGGGGVSSGGGSRGSGGPLVRSRSEPSSRKPSGPGGGSGGPSSRPDKRRPPGGSADERSHSRSTDRAPKADKDGKRKSHTGPGRDSDSRSGRIAKAAKRARKKARRKIARTGAGTEPCVQNETTEQDQKRKRDKKRRNNKWKWKAPKGSASSETQPEIPRRKRWKRDKPDGQDKKRRFKGWGRGSSDDRRERRRDRRRGRRERRKQREEAQREARREGRRERRKERQRGGRRWWKADPDWLNRWRNRRSADQPEPGDEQHAGDETSWSDWTEWMRPPPWADQKDDFEVEVEVVRPESTRQPALEAPQLQLPPAETPHHQEGTPTMTTPVRPTQYGDAELTVHDVIEADADMADEITAGVDEARATVAGCELLMTRLEMLHAKVVELKVPGVLAGMVTLLMEITLSVKAKAETIAAKLPAAAEAIRTAGANAETRHRPLADAVRDAGHTRPAEREYHAE